MDENAAATEPSGGRTIWVIGAMAAILLVVLASAAVVLVRGQGGVQRAPDSPEAALRAYVDAWETGDVDAAYDALTPRAQARVPFRDFREVIGYDEDVPTRIWIDDRTDGEDRVTLRLTVETTYDGFLGPDRDTHSLRVTLVKVDDAWRIDTPLVGTYSW